MKIAHVVTYNSPDGAFGGPTTVAFAQARALAEMGHEVTVFAGGPIASPQEGRVGDARLLEYPARRLVGTTGFAFMASPSMYRALRRKIFDFDVVHIHLARDLVMVPASLAVLRSSTQFVVQPHGMVDRPTRFLATLIDFAIIRRVLKRAFVAFALTETEQETLIDLQPRARVERIRNGINAGPSADACWTADGPVLFMARFHARKRPDAFVRMATLIRASDQSARFLMVGPDEGERELVTAAIRQSGSQDSFEIRDGVSPLAASRIMASASVYVLPSVGEVFPMTILEAFAAGIPVVSTRSLGIAELCEEFGAAVLTDGTPEELAAAVVRIRSDRDLAESLTRGGRALLEAELGIRQVAKKLASVYEMALEP
ncbi:glycosyltransferase [Microbacterium sp. EYE_5]|uniref:glycosyltransferase n=1 Tax=unclassified Microbacterium TaxID=2609290 RepID=UPI0020031813|nr:MULTISPECIES: glycosyltransferase [unclassified Microbacterium]MCK6079047.1 glycosyltransferase [Microbacterium sp. EYE_382]MCK6084317.1 glycosyltransferase [Microbacterium sp. EYE_384]MCK6123454.1 glycosyltransferase [Microbacterium sp. EYE_80]MCK6125081.1 glycosyltransferase [Microbacterium sp. EYE_79]MCK6140001.1 glycosyltransferase [Microbacterium sp. EYE_39]